MTAPKSGGGIAKVEIEKGSCALGDTREVFVVTPWEKKQFYDDGKANEYASKINAAHEAAIQEAEDRVWEEAIDIVSYVWQYDRNQRRDEVINTAVAALRSKKAGT